MDAESRTSPPAISPLANLIWQQMRRRPATALALATGLGGLLLLLLQSIWLVVQGEASDALRYGLYGGMAGFIATALGALPALFYAPYPNAWKMP